MIDPEQTPSRSPLRADLRAARRGRPRADAATPSESAGAETAGADADPEVGPDAPGPRTTAKEHDAPGAGDLAEGAGRSDMHGDGQHEDLSDEDALLGAHVLPDEMESTLVSTVRRGDPERLVNRLTELGWTIGVAESLTGGLLVASLVAVPGASSVVRGGVVAYATDIKRSVLGVDQTLLDAHGPVHPRVARQMADGARRVLGQDGAAADVGVATTGVAGPTSPDGQPVGTVHIAVSTPLGSRVESLLLTGDRDSIRAEATARAVRLILDAL